MNVIKLYSTPFLGSPDRNYASYISDKEQLKTCHFHDFYEIFLVNRGNAEHRVNGTSQKISTGFLCFIRPEDIHYYDEFSDDFGIINIIIPETIIKTLFDFLGEGFEKSRLLDAPLPPSVTLNYDDYSSMIHELEQLIIYKKIMKEKSDTAYRIALFDIITKHFPSKPLAKVSGMIPQWLRWLSLEMLKKENFTKGLPALYWLSGKSPEHLSRTCKKYLHKTPSKLVNDIRLEYAAKLLVSTNDPIIEIYEDSGFDSLSYFYHRFKEHYGVSPVVFRKKYFKNELQIYRMDDLSIRAEIPKSIPLAVGRANS
jgi:AraC family cel operon transcriptional repressor